MVTLLLVRLTVPPTILAPEAITVAPEVMVASLRVMPSPKVNAQLLLMAKLLATPSTTSALAPKRVMAPLEMLVCSPARVLDWTSQRILPPVTTLMSRTSMLLPYMYSCPPLPTVPPETSMSRMVNWPVRFSPLIVPLSTKKSVPSRALTVAPGSITVLCPARTVTFAMFQTPPDWITQSESTMRLPQVSVPPAMMVPRLSSRFCDAP